MKDLILFGICFFLIIFLIAMAICVPDAYIQAKMLNKRYGTNYTTWEIVWIGDKIIASDHIKIKE